MLLTAEAGATEIHDRLKADALRLEAARQAIQRSYQEIANLAATDPNELVQAQAPLNQIGAQLEQLVTILEEVEAQATNPSQDGKDGLQDAIDGPNHMSLRNSFDEAAAGSDAPLP